MARSLVLEVVFSVIMLAFAMPASTAFVSRHVSKVVRRQSALPVSNDGVGDTSRKGKLLVLGGTGFLGQAVSKRALLEGYTVTSLSRRGNPPENGDAAAVDYREGDARKDSVVLDILKKGDYVGVVHCIGLLLDDASGLGSWNRFASGSGSIPDEGSTYDTITRLTAFNAIDAAEKYATLNKKQPLPFCFTSAAEAGWPQMNGGAFVERFLAPDWLKRYLVAKREVEEKLLTSNELRPVIFRPSLIYSLDRPGSLVPVGAFFVGNKVGLPFVDRPVSVQALACAIVRSIGRNDVRGVQRYKDVDSLNE